MRQATTFSRSAALTMNDAWLLMPLAIVLLAVYLRVINDILVQRSHEREKEK